MEDQLAAAVGLLMDKQEIHDVLMRYCRGVDRNDRDLIASAFHPDAVDDLGSMQLRGSEIADRLGQGQRRGCMHFVGNVLIELDGDVARCESYWVSFQTVERAGDDYSRIRGARSIDRFERRDGVWRIAARTVVDDWSRLDKVLETVAGTGAHPGLPWPDDEVYKAAAASRSAN